MKCTDCHAPVHPVVAIDIDGTLGDYHGHLIKFLIGYTGTHPTRMYGGDETMKHWACAEFNMDERTWRDAKLAYRQGAMKRTMPVFRGARELTNRVQAAGAELWLTTTRPYLRLDNVDPDTRAWLAKQGITYDYLLYDEEKYAVLAERVGTERVVAVVDDLPEQVQAAATVFGEEVPFHRLNGYNLPVELDVPYVEHLVPDLAEMIEMRIMLWKDAR